MLCTYGPGPCVQSVLERAVASFHTAMGQLERHTPCEAKAELKGKRWVRCQGTLGDHRHVHSNNIVASHELLSTGMLRFMKSHVSEHTAAGCCWRSALTRCGTGGFLLRWTRAR